MLRVMFMCVCVLVSGMVVGVAHAQAPSVTAVLDTDEVELGSPFRVELRAEVSEGSAPTDPQLSAPSEFVVSGPNQSSSGVRVQISGGRAQTRRTMSATWFLVPSELGTFTIPSPTVVIDGEQVRATGSLTIKVVAVGQGAARPRSRAFGGFGSFFGGGSIFDFGSGVQDDIWNEEADDPTELEPKARELMLPQEPDEYVFLRLIPDKKRAVIGEQVTLSYYVYFRADMRLTDQREPPLTDFLRMELDRSPANGFGDDRPIITSVGRWRYHVKLLDQVAVFPLRAGLVSTGQLTGKFAGTRFGNRELSRTSNEVEIQVVEPPQEGRPPGYHMGDVGRFKLTAEVAPRETRVGDTVSVRVRLSGVGRLPSRLDVPERTGVEWLDPEKREEISSRGGKIGGTRTFGYAVRFREAGEVQLGDVELSYWDPKAQKYETATVELGRVRVKPGDPKDAAEEADEQEGDPFAALAKPRRTLGEYQPDADDGLSPLFLWTLLAVPPLGIALSQIAGGAFRSLGRRRRERREDPARLADKALREAGKEKDAKAAAAAYERALHLAIESASGIKSRGVLLGELAGKLRAQQIDEALADDAVTVIERCQQMRFDPHIDDAAADDLARLAKKTIKALLA